MKMPRCRPYARRQRRANLIGHAAHGLGIRAIMDTYGTQPVRRDGVVEPVTAMNVETPLDGPVHADKLAERYRRREKILGNNDAHLLIILRRLFLPRLRG